MKIIVFSDIHGNAVAFEKLLKCKDFKTADLKIFLGDILALSPHGNECIELIKNTDIVPLLGNNDSYVVNYFPEEEKKNKSKVIHIYHVKDIITQDNKKYVQSWEKEISFEFLGKKMLFTHYAWESDENVVKNPHVPNRKDVMQIFAEKNYDYIIFGHEHTPSIYRKNGKTLVGVGSLGAKYFGNYVLINIKDRVSIKHKKLNYDIHKVENNLINYDEQSTKEYHEICFKKDFFTKNKVLRK